MTGKVAVCLLMGLAACSGGGGSGARDAGPAADRSDALSSAIDSAAWDGAAEIKGRLCSPTVDSCPSKVCLLQRCVPRYLRTQVFASGNVASFDWFQVGKDGTFYVGGALAAAASIEVGMGGQGQRHQIGPVFILRVAADGRPMWIQDAGHRYWSSAAVTPDGGVVYVGYGRPPGSTGQDPPFRGYVWKIGPAGATEWVRLLEPGSAPAEANPGAVAVDGAGDIHVGGFFRGRIDLDPTAGTDWRESATGEVFLLRLSPAGDRRWSTLMGGLAARHDMSNRTTHPTAVIAPLAGGDIVVAGRGLLASAAASGETWTGTDVFLARFGTSASGNAPTWLRHVRSGGLLTEDAPTSDGHLALYSAWREGLYVTKLELGTGSNVWSVPTWADGMSGGPDTIVLLGQKPAPPDLAGRPPAGRETGVRQADVAGYDNEARLRFAIERPEKLLYSRSAVGPDGVVYLLGQMTGEPVAQSFAVDQPSDTFTPTKLERHYFISAYEP
jgi:hypothetical protein